MIAAEIQQAEYVLALSQIEGLGPRTLSRVLDAFPAVELLAGATMDSIVDRLGTSVSRSVILRIVKNWEHMFAAAQRLVSRHLENGITPIPLTAKLYSPQLKLISFLLPVLFAKGKVVILAGAIMIAVVGTRDAADG